MSAADRQPPRVVTVVLCDGAGRVLGALEPFAVPTPWWMQVGEIVDAVHAGHGLSISVLRIVETDDNWPFQGGRVTYLAELVDGTPPPAALQPAHLVDDEDRRRAVWARPGGVAMLTGWADDQLRAAGRARLGPFRQVRTWNLSTLLFAETDDGDVWLKAVPPFMAHEPALLARLNEPTTPVAVPPLLGRTTGVSLLGAVAGDDLYEAELPDLLRMVDALVELQADCAAHIAPLIAIGVPDRRPDALGHALEHFGGRSDVRGRLDDDECARVDALIDAITARFGAIEACGLPDSLVHGDFHPGNWRGEPRGVLTLLDWGDSTIGNPIADQTAFLAALANRGDPAATIDAVRQRWTDAWTRAVPGCDPERAADLLAPVAALERASLYRMFLDEIEPSEHRYHEHDPEDWVRRAIALARS